MINIKNISYTYMEGTPFEKIALREVNFKLDVPVGGRIGGGIEK